MRDLTLNLSQEWADYVGGVLKRHSASLRSQRFRTGLAHTTVSSWLGGVRPGYEGAVRFARGFGEDPAEALRAAGYEPLEAPGVEPRTLFWDGFERLVTISRDCQVPDPQVPSFRTGLGSMTRETVEVVLRDLISVQLERNPIRASKMRAALERDPVLGPLVTGGGTTGRAHALTSSTR